MSESLLLKESWPIGRRARAELKVAKVNQASLVGLDG